MKPDRNPIRVMRINIHIGNAPYAILAQGQHAKNRIVQITKSIGVIRHAMMRAPGRRIHCSTFGQQLSRKNRSTSRGCRSAEHFGKNRIGMGAQLVTVACRPGHFLRGLGLDQCLDVICTMPLGQRFGFCAGRADKGLWVQPAQRP